MTQVSTAKDAAMSRISAIVEELIKGNYIYQEELDKNELMIIFAGMLDRVVNSEDIISLEEERLIERVKGVMAFEATAGMLLDLTPEQIEMFDAAVEGR
ncbi:MAG: hypothetical protein EBE86_028165 [Hormoscilla sp. GUM202]|nr:hypothetical protein [Hormoscilla sp. GUM202]